MLFLVWNKQVITATNRLLHGWNNLKLLKTLLLGFTITTQV